MFPSYAIAASRPGRCGSPPAGPPARLRPPPPSVGTADEVREIVGALAADSMEGRRTGTPGSERAAHFLAERMRSLRTGAGRATAASSSGSTYEVVTGPRGRDPATGRRRRPPIPLTGTPSPTTTSSA